MASPVPPSCVEPNPDISGIGVRLAIYIQAFVNIACVILFSLDNYISPFEHKVLINASLNLFVSGCALLICTAVQGTTFGLSLHHALVVLNLNWIIGFSGLLYVLIFAYNFSKGQFGGRHFGPDDIKKPASVMLVVASMVHLCGVGAVGVWVWVKSKTFGGQPECNPLTSLRIFGKKFNALDPNLRKTSIAIYAIATIPAVNTIVLVLLASIVLLLLYVVYLLLKAFKPRQPRWSGLVLVGMIALVIIIDISFIVSTELMISRGCVREGEGQWTYGQTLALMALIIPIIDTGKMVKLWWSGLNPEDRQREREEGWTSSLLEMPLPRRG
ncbi:hypothetical protein MD484_g4152, partial [Candolleomyces efflorescens]